MQAIVERVSNADRARYWAGRDPLTRTKEKPDDYDSSGSRTMSGAKEIPPGKPQERFSRPRAQGRYPPQMASLRNENL